nr:hypothetical protein [Tanacetum cinerariifolium]
MTNSIRYGVPLSQPSQPFPAQDSEGPSKLVQGDFPVEKVTPVKRKYTKRRQQAKKNGKYLNDLWSQSRDAIFDEERFTSIPRPRGTIQPSSSKITEDEVEGTDDVPGPSVPRKSTRTRKAKSFGFDFQLYLVEGTRDKTVSLREYCYIIEEDPRTLSEAMASRDVAF